MSILKKRFVGLLLVSIALLTGLLQGGPAPAPSYRYGYIDTSGRLVFACKYTEAPGFSEGLAVVVKNQLEAVFDVPAFYH